MQINMQISRRILNNAVVSNKLENLSKGMVGMGGYLGWGGGGGRWAGATLPVKREILAFFLPENCPLANDICLPRVYS